MNAFKWETLLQRWSILANAEIVSTSAVAINTSAIMLDINTDSVSCLIRLSNDTSVCTKTITTGAVFNLNWIHHLPLTPWSFTYFSIITKDWTTPSVQVIQS